jgi:hypothetical protein
VFLCLNVSTPQVPILDFKSTVITRAAAGLKGRLLRTREWENLRIWRAKGDPKSTTAVAGRLLVLSTQQTTYERWLVRLCEPQYQKRQAKERCGNSEAFEGCGYRADDEETNDESDHERCPA